MTPRLFLRSVAKYGVMEGFDRSSVPLMEYGDFIREDVRGQIPRFGMTGRGFMSQHVQIHSPYAAGGTGEIPIDDILGKSYGLERLRTKEGTKRRNAKACKSLEQTFLQGSDIPFLCAFFAERMPFRGNLSFPRQPLNSFQSGVRIDGVHAVADELCHVHDFAGLAAFRDDAAGMTKTAAYEVVMQAGTGQKRRDRSMVFVHGGITDDE